MRVELVYLENCLPVSPFKNYVDLYLVWKTASTSTCVPVCSRWANIPEKLNVFILLFTKQETRHCAFDSPVN